MGEPLELLSPISTFVVPRAPQSLVVPLSMFLPRRVIGMTIIRMGVTGGGRIRLPPLLRATTIVLTRWAAIFYEARRGTRMAPPPLAHATLNVPVKLLLKQREAFVRSVPLLRTSVLTVQADIVFVNPLDLAPPFATIGTVRVPL